MKKIMTEIAEKLFKTKVPSVLIYNPEEGEFYFQLKSNNTNEFIIAEFLSIGLAVKFASQMYLKYPEILNQKAVSVDVETIKQEFNAFYEIEVKPSIKSGVDPLLIGRIVIERVEDKLLEYGYDKDGNLISNEHKLAIIATEDHPQALGRIVGKYLANFKSIEIELSK